MRKRSSWIVIFVLLSSIALAQFPVDINIGLSNVIFNQSNTSQNSLVVIDEVNNYNPNVSMSISLHYTNTGLQNVSVNRNRFGFEDPSNLTIDQDGSIVILDISDDIMSWEADLDTDISLLSFNVSAPTLITNFVSVDNGYVRNFSISSDNSLSNVSVVLFANSSFESYTIFHLIDGVYVNQSSTYSLNRTGNNITFYGFNLSTQFFSLTAPACIESWSCTAWSDPINSCGTRVCTDLNSCGTTNSKPSESATCPDSSSSATSASSGGGGGGGGGASGSSILTTTTGSSVAVDNQIPFDFVTGDTITVRLRLDESRTVNVGVVNSGTNNISLTFDSSDIDFGFFEGNTTSRSLDVETGRRSALPFTVFGSRIDEPGIYQGTISITGQGLEKSVQLIVEYEVERPLFDVELIVDPVYSVINPGDEIVSTVTILDLADVGPVDVLLEYSVLDANNNVIFFETRNTIVDDDTEIINAILLPNDIPLGDYVLGVKAIYDGSVGISSYAFVVSDEDLNRLSPIIFAIIIGSTLIGAIVLLALINEISYRYSKFKGGRK